MNIHNSSYLEFLQDLEKKVDQDWDGISSSLEEIRRSLLSRKGCLVNMTADEKNLNNSTKYLSKFLDSLPSASSAGTNSWNTQLSFENEAIIIHTQVLSIYMRKTILSFHLASSF